MRCDAIDGYYVQYKDSGHPVEVFDRVHYAFQAEDRTCLVTNPAHLAMLLKTDRYRVVGVELGDGFSKDPDPDEPQLHEDAPIPKLRGRPRKGR